MQVEEIIRESRSGGPGGESHLEQVVSPETVQALLSWASSIEERTFGESPSTEDTATAGYFKCLVDNAAHSIKRLHEAYTQGGRLTS